MRHIIVNESLFDANDEAVLTDRNGKEAYFIEGNLESESNKLTVLDIERNPVVVLDIDTNAQLNTIDINVGKKKKMSLSEMSQTEYELECEHLDVDGELSAMSFDVLNGYRKVGKLRKRWINRGPSYELTIFEEENELALVGLVTGLAFVKEGR